MTTVIFFLCFKVVYPLSTKCVRKSYEYIFLTLKLSDEFIFFQIRSFRIRLFSLSFRRRSIIIVGKTSKDKNLRRRIEKKRKDPKKTLLSFEDDDKTQQNKAPLTKRLIKRKSQIKSSVVVVCRHSCESTRAR